MPDYDHADQVSHLRAGPAGHGPLRDLRQLENPPHQTIYRFSTANCARCFSAELRICPNFRRSPRLNFAD